MRNIKIKTKLILLFIIIKILPLLLISYIAVIGAKNLNDYFSLSTKNLFNESKTIIKNTANITITDSIKALDKKSQSSLEVLSYNIANNIAAFLYERDKDILFLSKLPINQNTLKSFYENKTKDILFHDKYYYDDEKEEWQAEKTKKVKKRSIQEDILIANKKEFNYIDPINSLKKSIPLYKEVVFFDLKGEEKYKILKKMKFMYPM